MEQDWTDLAGSINNNSNNKNNSNNNNNNNNNNNSTVSNDENQITLEWMKKVFPDKDPNKVVGWLKVLADEEVSTFQDLEMLKKEDWDAFGLAVAVKNRLQSALQERQQQIAQSKVSSIKITSTRPLTQLDCIVMDISSSMKARSSLDALKTREDMSKILFHTMIDKLVGLEMSHAVGLIAFGESITTIGQITRDYEKFHDELGRLDAVQHATKLYDSIFEAALYLQKFAKDNSSQLSTASDSPCVLRIFVLTDGEDNASKMPAWEVAQYLQKHKILLDVFPLAGRNDTLQAMSSACSGFTLVVTSEEQGLSLFEREAILHVRSRETQAKEPITITDAGTLRSLVDKNVEVQDVKVVVPKTINAPVLRNVAEVQAKAEVQGKSDGKAGSASLRRIAKEYAEFLQNPPSGWQVFVAEDDMTFWKAIWEGDKGSLYEGGVWMVYLQFPSDYPFKPMKLKFLTPIYHPNISNDGHVCLDILKDSWSPAFTAVKVLQSISALMHDPNPNDPLDAYKAQVYLQERSRYNNEVKSHTVKYAGASLQEVFSLYNITP